MTTFTATLPATNASPVNAVGFDQTGPGRGTAIVDQKRAIGEYAITEFRADGGRGFRFAKLEGGTDKPATGYTVFLAADQSWEFDSCECKGSLRHGRCKHVEAARAILENGWAGPVDHAKPVRFADPILKAFFGPRLAARKAAAVSRDTADLQGGF